MKRFVKFDQFGIRKLWNLRKEVAVGSVYTDDYKNSYSIAAESMASFFDGYVDFMFELANEEHPRMNKITFDWVMAHYDNMKTLWQWYCCSDDLSWVKYEKNIKITIKGKKVFGYMK